MNSAAVVRVLQGKPRQLLDDLNAELKTNLGTSHYHRLSEQELVERHSLILQSLSEWLNTRDNAALQQNGEDLGKRRFKEGTPLGQVALALILVEKILCAFLDGSGQLEPTVRDAITEFFQKFAYYTVKGYEAELAVSNRLATRPPAAEAHRKESAKPEEGDMEISRGGQVGEYGG